MLVANPRVRRKSFAHHVIVGPGYGASGGVLARNLKQFGCSTISLSLCNRVLLILLPLSLLGGWRLPLAEVDL
jgi:hypothetical protein